VFSGEFSTEQKEALRTVQILHESFIRVRYFGHFNKDDLRNNIEDDSFSIENYLRRWNLL